MSVGLKVLPGKFLVKPEPVESVTKGGIILPQTLVDSNRKVISRGTLLQTGEFIDRNGDPFFCDFKIGDEIFYDKFSGTEIFINDERYLVLSHDDIFAVFEE